MRAAPRSRRAYRRHQSSGWGTPLCDIALPLLTTLSVSSLLSLSVCDCFIAVPVCPCPVCHCTLWVSRWYGHTALCDTALSLSHYFVCFIAAVCVCQCLPCLFHRCLLSCLSLRSVGVTAPVKPPIDLPRHTTAVVKLSSMSNGVTDGGAVRNEQCVMNEQCAVSGPSLR